MDVFFSKDSQIQDSEEDTFLSNFVHKYLGVAGVSSMAFFIFSSLFKSKALLGHCLSAERGRDPFMLAQPTRSESIRKGNRRDNK